MKCKFFIMLQQNDATFFLADFTFYLKCFCIGE